MDLLRFIVPCRFVWRYDRIQLQQVVINLVINGIQAMVTVTDWPRVLVIRTQPRTDAGVSRDAGIGIAAENLDQLFDPLYTTKADELGMGLSICRSIVEAHATYRLQGTMVRG